jgi:type IV secretion system protein VirB11
MRLGLSRSELASAWGAFLRTRGVAHERHRGVGSDGLGQYDADQALVLETPRDERLIVLKDAAELSLISHLNSVRLLSSMDGQGLARVSTKELLEASLRMRADRILLSELRGEEAYWT